MDDEFYDDDIDDDEVIENAVLCPNEDVTGHQILKEKEIGRGKDYLLRCETCSTVHEIQFRAPPLKRVPFRWMDLNHTWLQLILMQTNGWN